MPKSGKTTVCDVVVHFLKRSGFKVGEYHGGGRYEAIDKSSLLSLNLHLAMKAADFILINSEREKVDNRLFIMDRGIFDRRIFTRALRTIGKIGDIEASAVLNLLNLSELLKHIDGVFLFVTQPALSIEREYHNKLIKQPGRVMNLSFLEVLRNASLQENSEWQTKLQYSRLIDTSDHDGRIEHCAKLVADDVLRIIGSNR